MTSQPTPPLADLERDALAELSNIAMARAANSLRQMVKHQVLLSVPSVDILSKDDAAQIISKPDSPPWSPCVRISVARSQGARC